ncbi:MAG: histone deacetylase [Saprospiraceae bacterium]
MLKIAFHPLYKHQLPAGHRFPMEKYELIPEQLLYEGSIQQSNLFEPDKLGRETILLTHKKDYLDRLLSLTLTEKEIRRIGFPLSQQLVDRCLHIGQGTLDCTRYASEFGISMNIAGGTHHAHSDFGEGFCLLNDQAMAANYLIHSSKAKQILIVDLDVHQGNGTAEIFRNEPRVFTFSMHGEKNFPARKDKSDLDIALPDGANDDLYLGILQSNLATIMQNLKPDFVFYNAGVDVLADDRLGRLAMSIAGCKMRDQIVLAACKSGNIPLVISMGGGYSKKLSTLIEAHANTYRVAQEMYF